MELYYDNEYGESVAMTKEEAVDMVFDMCLHMQEIGYCYKHADFLCGCGLAGAFVDEIKRLFGWPRDPDFRYEETEAFDDMVNAFFDEGLPQPTPNDLRLALSEMYDIGHEPETMKAAWEEQKEVINSRREARGQELLP